MSDLHGRAKRAVSGFRAQWELAGELQPNPYVQRGQPDGPLTAVCHNRVYCDGKLVTDRTARWPNTVALTERQWLQNDMPADLLPLKPAALKLFEEYRESHKPKLVHEREAEPVQMAAQQPQAFQMKG